MRVSRSEKGFEVQSLVYDVICITRAYWHRYDASTVLILYCLSHQRILGRSAASHARDNSKSHGNLARYRALYRSGVAKYTVNPAASVLLLQD